MPESGFKPRFLWLKALWASRGGVHLIISSWQFGHDNFRFHPTLLSYPRAATPGALGFLREATPDFRLNFLLIWKRPRSNPAHFPSLPVPPFKGTVVKILWDNGYDRANIPQNCALLLLDMGARVPQSGDSPSGCQGFKSQVHH